MFLDSSSTAYFLARRIAEGRLQLRVLTNSGPVMQVLAGSDDPHVELYAIGGMLRRLTGSYVGPSSVRMIREHFADRLFLSVTGRDARRRAHGRGRSRGIGQGGHARPGQGIGAAARRVEGLGTGPAGRRADRTVSLVLADGLSQADAERLRAAGATVRLVGEAGLTS